MIWELVLSKIPFGRVLPWWAVLLRGILFPIDSLYWKLSKTRGYQWENDTWIIDGVAYSGDSLRKLSQAHNEIYQVSRVGNIIVFKRVYNLSANNPKIL